MNHPEYLRISQIVGRPVSTKNPEKYPAIPGILPISASSWWAKTRSGEYPQPVKLGPKTTVWSTSDVLAVANGTWRKPTC